MKLSVFTPTHNPVRLVDAYESFKDSLAWDEWVIAPNGNCREGDIPEVIRKDPRVVLHQAPDDCGSRIGALKGFACDRCTGDILVELDHDDMLVSPVLEAIKQAFLDDPAVVLVYSNFANINEDWSCRHYNPFYGWVTRPWAYNGRALEETLAPPPTAHTASSMWWGPNHVRAYRRTAYDAVGGYNTAMAVGDDQELC